MPIVAGLVLIVLAVIALIPVSIVQRFRRGTMRRPARRWVATLNLVTLSLSAFFFGVSAFVMSRWVPEALTYTLGGLAVGAVLAFGGLLLTRWDHSGGRWHYTPNRWLVLGITAVVAARVLYGFWRTWTAWQASVETMTWVVASGLATSMSAGAVVLGYYLVYWGGIRARLDRIMN